ncbi:MAG: DNA repair protein RecO [Clostridiales bacterium]|jgi:DNA repair protein RecO (recombination protein O)|nr:DNA repair protein RecO [Clostridiales bacterium]
MDGIKLNALCVRAVDYKDNKTLLTLCTAEKGKINASIRGVKSEKSKLRFAASLLCFGEYILNEKNGYYTVVNCTPIDGFYEVRKDVERLYAALAAIEILDKITEENSDVSGLLFSCLNALKEIAYGTPPLRALLEYTLKTAAECGYALNLKICPNCGAPVSREYFDAENGGGTCAGCRSRNAAPISRGAYGLLYRIVYGVNGEDSGENLSGGNINGLKDKSDDETKKNQADAEEKYTREGLKLMHKYFSVCADARINALGQLLTLY